MLKQGVYTAQCPQCSRSIIMHVLFDGSISPKKCSKCEAEFGELKNGEERNTFVIVAKTKKSTIVVNQEAEKTKKTDEKKSFETFQLTKKSSKNNEESKKNKKFF